MKQSYSTFPSHVFLNNRLVAAASICYSFGPCTYFPTRATKRFIRRISPYSIVLDGTLIAYATIIRSYPKENGENLL